MAEPEHDPTPAPTAVVPTRAEVAAEVRKSAPGDLTPEARTMIAERKAHGALIAQMKGATWAKEIDENTIRAIAVWAKANDIDAATEIDVLGGNIYVNSKEAYRKLGELTAGGYILKHGPIDWIHSDKRLEALQAAGDEWAATENTRRLRLRVEHHVPEEATTAGVYRIWHRELSEPVVGVKWNQKGRKITINKRDGGTFQKDADPVGDLNPMETIESRAIRRAMLKLRGAVPALAERLRVQAEEAVALSEVVATARVVERERSELARVEPRQLAPGGYDLPEQVPEAEAVPVDGAA